MRKLRNSALAVVTATALLAGGTAANAAEEAANDTATNTATETAKGSSDKVFGNALSHTKEDSVDDNTDECVKNNVTNVGNGSTLPEFNAGSVNNNHKSTCVQDGTNTAGKIGTKVEANKALTSSDFSGLTKTVFGKLFVALTVLTGIGFAAAAANFVNHFRVHPMF